MQGSVLWCWSYCNTILMWFKSKWKIITLWCKSKCKIIFVCWKTKEKQFPRDATFSEIFLDCKQLKRIWSWYISCCFILKMQWVFVYMQTLQSITFTQFLTKSKTFPWTSEGFLSGGGGARGFFLNFSRKDQKWWIRFFPLETKKTTFCCWNFQNPGWAKVPHAPLLAPMIICLPPWKRLAYWLEDRDF